MIRSINEKKLGITDKTILFGGHILSRLSKMRDIERNAGSELGKKCRYNILLLKHNVE